MADETLSLRIQFDEVEKFKSDLEAARAAVLSLGDSAIVSAASFNDLVGAVGDTNSALNQLAKPKSVEIDSAPIDKAIKSSGKAGDALADFGIVAQKSSSQAEGALGGLAASVQTLVGSFGHLSPAVQAVFAGFAGAGAFVVAQKGLAEIGSLAHEAVGAFKEAQLAATQFATALGSLGKFSQEAIAQFNDFADTMRETTTVGITALRSAGALIAQVGRLSGDKLIEATQAAVQLSAVLGRDLNSSALILAKAAQGNTAALGRFGIVLDESIPKGEKFAALLKLINDQFAGTAQMQAQTLAGQIERMGNQWHAFVKDLGSTALVFLPTIEKMRAGLERFNHFLEERGFKVKPVQDFGGALEDVSEKINRAAKAQEAFARIPAKDVRFKIDAAVVAGRQVEKTREELERSFGTLRAQVHFAIAQGDVQEARRTMQALAEQIASLTRRGLAKEADELKKIRDEAQKTLEITVVLRANQAVEEAGKLTKFIEEHQPGFTPEFLDADLKKKIEELRSGRITIPVELSPSDKSKETLQAAADALVIRAKNLDQQSFVEAGTNARKIVEDAFGEGLDLTKEIAKRQAELQSLFAGMDTPDIATEGQTARVAELAKELDELNLKLVAARERAEAMAPGLETLTKQRELRIDDAKFKAKAEEATKFLRQLQADVPEFKLEVDATAAESTLPKVVSLVEQVQQFSKEPLALRLDLGSMVADAEDAAPAVDALNQAIGRLLSQHDDSALISARKALEDFVRDPAIQNAFDAPTIAVRTRASELLRDLDTEIARLTPQLKARELTMTFHAQFEAQDIPGMEATIERLKALVKERPELRPFVNLTDLENGVLEAQSILSPLTQERGLEARLKFAVDIGNLPLALETLEQIKRFEQEFPEFKPAVDLKALQESVLQIETVRDEFQAAMQVVEDTTQIVTAAFTDGWQAAADAVKKIITDLVQDIIRKLAKLAFFKLLTKAIPGFGALSFNFKPGAAPPPTPEKPTPAGKAAPAPAPAPVPEPIALKAPKIELPKFPELKLAKIQLPRFPKLEVGKMAVPKIPELKAPKLVAPQIPPLEVPAIRVPRLASPGPVERQIPVAPRFEIPEFSIVSMPPIVLPKFPAVAARIAPADVRKLLPRAPEMSVPLQELPTVNFARLETTRAIAVTGAAHPEPQRTEPESILKRKPGPDVQLTFQGAFDGESVRRQFQSGSINRELVRISRRGRL